MGVFALKNGRLVAAPVAATHEVSDDVLRAVRAQALDFLERPLFPVTWENDASQSLIAIDPTGNVVTVEVMRILTADSFVSALARAGRHAELTRGALARMYPAGEESFSTDYATFIDSAPPQTRRGPRLIVFAVEAEPSVHRPLIALRGVGVDAWRIVIHDGINGLLVEISENFDTRGMLAAPSHRHVIESAESEEATMKERRFGMRRRRSVARQADTVDSQSSGYSHQVAAHAPISATDDPPAVPESAKAAATVTADVTPESVRSGSTPPAPSRERLLEEQAHIYAQPAGNVSGRDSARRYETQPESESGATSSVSRSVNEGTAQDERVAHRSATPLASRHDRVSVETPRAQSHQEAAESQAWNITGWAHPRTAYHPVQPNNSREESEDSQVISRSGADILSGEEIPARDIGPTLYDRLAAEARRVEQRLWDMSAPPAHDEALIYSERSSSDASSQAVADAALRSDRWRPDLYHRSGQQNDARAMKQGASRTESHTGVSPIPLGVSDRGVQADVASVSHNAATSASTPEARGADSSPSAAKTIGAMPPPAGQRGANTPVSADPRLVRIAREMGAVNISWRSRRKRSRLNATLRADGLIEIAGVGIFADPTQAARQASGCETADGWRLWHLPDGRCLGEA
ncbi:hypothetical protein [Trueperella sp. LYQ141]|uniref:hypothetical protein n=1 Tax=Trueperella sp. LYQ141 TaxID=3391058 RepID=UPI0039836A07